VAISRGRAVILLGRVLRWAGVLLCLGSGPFLFIIAFAALFIMPSGRQDWIKFSVPFAVGVVLFVVGSLCTGERLV